MCRLDRRSFFVSSTTVVAGFLAGCPKQETDGAPSKQETDGTASKEELTPEDFLPRETDGWVLERSENGTLSYLGGTASIRAEYTSPDGDGYEVVIMAVSEDIGFVTTAKTWKCQAGWTVALGYRGFAIVAGTGTDQRRFTPEAPPQMTRTPIPGTTETTKSLLANSPELTRETIDRYEVTEEDCRR